MGIIAAVIVIIIVVNIHELLTCYAYIKWKTSDILLYSNIQTFYSQKKHLILNKKKIFSRNIFTFFFLLSLISHFWSSKHVSKFKTYLNTWKRNLLQNEGLMWNPLTSLGTVLKVLAVKIDEDSLDGSFSCPSKVNWQESSAIYSSIN